ACRVPRGGGEPNLDAPTQRQPIHSPPFAGSASNGTSLMPPFSVIILGLVVGMTYGVLAIGLVLVHRSSRFVNFAHGQVGAFAAILVGLAITRWHVPYWAAFLVAVLLAAVISAGVESVVLRRLRNAPSLMAMVATLGVAQVLLLGSVVVNGQSAAGQFFPQPSFLPTFHLRGLTVTPAHSGMLLLTPL